MNLPERIAKATQIADELNRDPMLCQEVKHLITDVTASRLTTENCAALTLAHPSRRAYPQFAPQPASQPRPGYAPAY